MDKLQIVAGSVAVCKDRLVVICKVRRDGRVDVRDLVTAQINTVSVATLSARKIPERERKAAELHARITQASTKQFRAAQMREQLVVQALSSTAPLVQSIKAVSLEHEINERTLWRWVSAYRNWPSLEALVLDGRGVRPKQRRLSPQTESIIRQVIDDVYLTQPKGTIQATCEELWRRCELKGVHKPSRNTVTSRIKGLDPWVVAHHQLGRDEANRKFGPKPGSLQRKAPLSVVQIDHTLVDIHVVDDVERKSIGRPWITVAIDVATRCVLGFHLSLESPSVASVAACLAHACLPKEAWLEESEIESQWPTWGLPRQLQADNAREFKTEALTRGCSEWGIEMTWRPIGRPHYGGHIERLIGTLMGRIHLLPGTSQSNPQQRGRYDAEKAARFTMTELEHWIALEISGRYHLSVHRSIRKAPLNAWQDWYAENGAHPAIPGNLERFRISFMPIIRRKLLRQGITFNRIQYWDDSLLAIANIGDTLLLRYDPRDISCLFVLDADGQYWRVPYADITQPAITLAEAKAAMKAVDKRERGRGASYLMMKQALSQRQIENKAGSATKKARRSRQRTIEAKRQTSDANPAATTDEIDFNKTPTDYGVEIWDDFH
jgi:putative transposase